MMPEAPVATTRVESVAPPYFPVADRPVASTAVLVLPTSVNPSQSAFAWAITLVPASSKARAVRTPLAAALLK